MLPLMLQTTKSIEMEHWYTIVADYLLQIQDLSLEPLILTLLRPLMQAEHQTRQQLPEPLPLLVLLPAAGVVGELAPPQLVDVQEPKLELVQIQVHNTEELIVPVQLLKLVAHQRVLPVLSLPLLAPFLVVVPFVLHQ